MAIHAASRTISAINQLYNVTVPVSNEKEPMQIYTGSSSAKVNLALYI